MKNTHKATATRSRNATSTTRKVATATVRPTDHKVAAKTAEAIATARKSSGRTREAMRVAILAAIARCLATGRPVLLAWQETDADGQTVARSFSEDNYSVSGSYYGAHRPVNNLLTDDQRGLVRVACVTGPRDRRRFTAERGAVGDVYVVPAAMSTRKTDPVPAGM